MSYRSFKRVLGETSLERKCRILFGACLLLLISSAFWYAERNAEKLVKGGPRQTGQFFVDLRVMAYHFERVWFTDRAVREAAQQMNEELNSQNFEWEILVLDMEGVQEDANRWEQKTRPAKNLWEKELLNSMADEVNARFDKYGRPELPLSSIDAIRDTETAGTLARGSRKQPAVETGQAASTQPSVFDEPIWELFPTSNAYHYYQAIYWKPGCVVCHRVAKEWYAHTPEQWAAMGKPPVLRVMKVVIPSEPTRNKILETRAILSAIAIATVFVSMLALYAVVRYVIVKPLNHLRDVSDEISRGNHELRASIQTNDEFEDLAASFNRMLRHLVDAQSKLRTVNADLDAKVDQLAQANMQLHEMNRVKSDFLANMSHELRTPLNSIIGFADILKEKDSLSDKQKRYAENISVSGRSLLEMINDILDLAKTESGKMDIRLTEFNIGPVVTAQCELLRSLSEEKNIDMAVSVQPDLPPLYQDQGKIQQILLNLLSNAIKFTPEGGRIAVSAERDHLRRLVLTIEDTGVGIAEEDHEIIFEKFRQGNSVLGSDNLTREFSGTGLGLSIVKELCKLLGGEVFFQSELGKGSEFRVRVPWTLADRPKLDSSLTKRLDEATKPRRLDFSATAEPASIKAYGPDRGASVSD